MKAANHSHKIAVIGAGISGLACAYKLSLAGHAVTLFEANDYFGGHTHTVDVTLNGISYGVDTGFLVFNHKTYPNLVQLFDKLRVETVATDMSFSVKLPLAQRTLEWSGGSLNTVFAQRRNLLNPSFLRMLRDILRFNKQATALATQADGAPDKNHVSPEKISLGEFLARNNYSSEFRRWYLLPMAGCIWSCPTEQMLAFPLSTFVNFCHNHGLLQISDRPRWHTVKGGACHYVEKLLADIPDKRLSSSIRHIRRSTIEGQMKIHIDNGSSTEVFDHVVLASHSDQSLAMLQDATPLEQKLLSAVKYQANRAVLHTDASCLPRNKSTWSA